MSDDFKIVKEFDYLRNKYIIPVYSSKVGEKLSDDIILQLRGINKTLSLILESFCEKHKMENFDTKTIIFIHEDIEMKLETAYITVSEKFNHQFILDAIKVIPIEPK